MLIGGGKERTQRAVRAIGLENVSSSAVIPSLSRVRSRIVSTRFDLDRRSLSHICFKSLIVLGYRATVIVSFFSSDI